MAAISFDTLKFANKLKQAGVAPLQAEANAEALAEVFEANLTELATKGDLKTMGEINKIDLNTMAERFENKLEKLELRMTIKLGTIVVVAIGAVAAIVRLM